MAIQRLVAKDDQFPTHTIGLQLRRNVTPEECYQCESAYQYARQMPQNERLCAGDAFYDLYAICVGCIEDNIDSGRPREYVEPDLGRYVDYCAQFTSLTKWASRGAASTTSATSATRQTQSTTTASTEGKEGEGADEVSITGTTVERKETSISASITNTILQTTTKLTKPEDSASSSNVSKASSSSSKAWIAGAVVPSVLFVALAVAFAIWWWRRKGRAPKTPNNLHGEDVAGTPRFDKPELDSEGIPRPRSKEEATTSTYAPVIGTAVLPVPAEMSENGWNRSELQGEVTGGTGQNHGPGPCYELPAIEAEVYELPPKL